MLFGSKDGTKLTWLIVGRYHRVVADFRSFFVATMPPKGSKSTQLDTPGRKAAFTALFTLLHNVVVEEKIFVKADKALKVSRDRLRRVWKQTLVNMARHLNHQNSTDGDDDDVTHIEVDWRDVFGC